MNGFINQLSCIVFFFQAEDGIRDRDVTGVQTCALPISLVKASTAFYGLSGLLRQLVGAPAGVCFEIGETLIFALQSIQQRKQCYVLVDVGRSEERRVGKECRSRWWPYRYKKNSNENVVT